LTIAVTDFPDLSGTTSDLSRYIAERLTTVLSQSGRVMIVERRRLLQVLGELGWTLSDLLDPKKAPRAGQMAGVDAVVVGSVVSVGSAVDIEGRLVVLSTSQVLAGASVTIPKDSTLDGLMARGRQVPAAPAPVRTVTPVDRSAPESYMLLSKAGAVWKYQLTMEKQEGLIFKRATSQQGTLIISNDGEETFDGQITSKFRWTYTISGADRVEESYFYRVHGDTLLQVGEEGLLPDGRAILATHQPGIVLLRHPVTSGQQWDTTFDSTPVGGRPRTLTLKVMIGSEESVTVPAGTFQGVRVDIQAGPLQITEWLVPGMGRVKRIVAKPNSRSEAVLFEYSIPQ
jgi:TolB-like protein